MIWSYRGQSSYLSVAFNPSGDLIAYGGLEGGVSLLDAATGSLVAEFLKNGACVGDVAFSPSGKLLAAGTDADTIYVWNVEERRQAMVLEGHSGYVNGVAFSPLAGDSLLASASHDGTLRLWDLSSQRLIVTLEGHKAQVLRLAFSRDGTIIASVGWDGMVRLWGLSRN